MKKIFFGFLIAGLVVTGCSENEQSPEEKIVTKQEMIDLNRKSVQMETNQIEKYISCRGWEMEETGSGLRYRIYEKSTKPGVHPKENQQVVVSYTVSLINGKEIYASDSLHPASFIVGHDNVESGLQEGIRFLVPGDKAIFIIPSHLAHGYTGDFDKIPHNATVIFDIHLLEIK